MSFKTYQDGSWKETANLNIGYTKTECDNLFIKKRVADVAWRALDNVTTMSGSVWFCCKNNIVYIEGVGLAWSDYGGAQKVMAQGIPDGYQPVKQCHGLTFINAGRTPNTMCWIDTNGTTVKFWASGAPTGNGMLFLTYPI